MQQGCIHSFVIVIVQHHHLLLSLVALLVFTIVLPFFTLLHKDPSPPTASSIVVESVSTVQYAVLTCTVLRIHIYNVYGSTRYVQ